MARNKTKVIVVMSVSAVLAGTLVLLAVVNSGGRPQPPETKEEKKKKETVAKAAPKRPTRSSLPAWKEEPRWQEEAALDLKFWSKKKLTPEPLPKPEFMTDLEYQLKVNRGASVLSLFPDWRVPKFPDLVGRAEPDLRELYPETLRVLSREYFQQWASSSQQELDVVIAATPKLRLLLSGEAKSILIARPFVEERKSLFRQFAKITGESGDWSLMHPFDDLLAKQMRTAIEVAQKVEKSGLGSVSSEHRQLLLKAGAFDFFKKHMVE